MKAIENLNGSTRINLEVERGVRRYTGRAKKGLFWEHERKQP